MTMFLGFYATANGTNLPCASKATPGAPSLIVGKSLWGKIKISAPRLGAPIVKADFHRCVRRDRKLERISIPRCDRVPPIFAMSAYIRRVSHGLPPLIDLWVGSSILKTRFVLVNPKSHNIASPRRLSFAKSTRWRFRWRAYLLFYALLGRGDLA